MTCSKQQRSISSTPTLLVAREVDTSSDEKQGNNTGRIDADSGRGGDSDGYVNGDLDEKEEAFFSSAGSSGSKPAGGMMSLDEQLSQLEVRFLFDGAHRKSVHPVGR